ncbi:MAG: hypothetical protein ACOVQ2_06005 [Flavobacterium sp.]
MFILYKNRTFGEYISETFDFLKENGKHFFKQFFTILGIPLLILSFLMYYIMNIYQNFILNNSINSGNMPDFELYFSNNLPILFIVLSVFIVFTILLSVLLYSFPVLYLKLYDENNGLNFGTKELINEFKNNFTRILVYFFLMFFTMIVIMFIVIIPLFISIITIVGPFIILGFIYLFNILSLYIYLNNKNLSFFDSIKIAFDGIKNNFWSTVVSVFVMYILVSIMSGIVSMIGAGFNFVEMITTIQTKTLPEDNEIGIYSVFVAFLTILSYIVQYTLMNLPMLTGGLVYYSMQDHKENINVKSDIDLIGTQELD